MLQKVASSTARGKRKEIDADIGSRVRARRNTLGLSQETIAAELGITFQQVQKYEKGTNRISGSRLLTICEVLKVSPNELLNYDQEKSTYNHPAIVQFLSIYGNAGLNHLSTLASLPPSMGRKLLDFVDCIREE